MTQANQHSTPLARLRMRVSRGIGFIVAVLALSPLGSPIAAAQQTSPPATADAAETHESTEDRPPRAPHGQARTLTICLLHWRKLVDPLVQNFRGASAQLPRETLCHQPVPTGRPARTAAGSSVPE
jgi:hypothetical protein